MKVGLINYGLNNLSSISKILDKLDVEYSIVNQPEELSNFDKLILPGIGNFNKGLDNLNKFTDQLNYLVTKKKIPILGICLGMQLFANSSEEAKNKKALGYIDAEIKKIPKTNIHSVPHVGFNYVEDKKYYFSHSFYMKINEKNSHNIKIKYVNYNQELPAIIEQDNILGVQFHPEVSGKNGLELFKYFIERFK